MSGFFSGKRVLSLVLCGVLLWNAVPVRAESPAEVIDPWLMALFGDWAEESGITEEDQRSGVSPTETELTVTMLEGEAQPGKTTHKGFLHTQMVILGENGMQDKEVYLPVVVSPEEEIYVPLEIIASHLDLPVKANSPQEMEVEIDGGSLIFQNLKRQIRFVPKDLRYENAFYLEGRLPAAWFDERCCVGLDDFLNAAGCTASYEETDEDGKGVLSVFYSTAPSRLDTYRRFYEDLEERYRFLIADLGGTAGREQRSLLGNAIVGYLSKFWDSDMIWFTLASPIPFASAQKFANFYYDKAFMEKYLSCQLAWNEAIGEKVLSLGSNMADGLSGVFDAYTDGKEIWQATRTKALTVNYIQSEQVRESLMHAWKMQKYHEKVASTGLWLAGSLLDYICLEKQFEKGDDYEVEAAEEFIRHWTASGSYLSNEMVNVTKMEMEHYKKEGKNSWLEAAKKYGEQKGFSFTAGALGVVGLEVPHLAVAALGWNIALDVLTGGDKELSESYMAGYYGVMYELDAIRAAENQYRKVLSMETPTEEDLHSLELLTYHAAKACYCTRCLILEGCGALKVGLGDLTGSDSGKISRETVQTQKKINEDLALLMARMRGDVRFTGLFPGEQKERMQEQKDHFPNVLLNVAELSGRVLEAETGKPAKNAGIRIFGDDEIEIAVERTDSDGFFCISFDLDDGDLFENRPDRRDLTLQLSTVDYAMTAVPLAVRSGHRYQIDGLYTGEFSKENFIYVTGASTMRDHVVLDCHLAILDENTVLLNPPGWLGTGDPIYCPIGDQIYVEEKVTRLILPMDFPLTTVYGHAFDGLEWVAYLMDEIEESDEMQTLMKDDLTTAEEINAYLELYHQYSGEYPAYMMKAGNSSVKKMEPIFIVRG